MWQQSEYEYDVVQDVLYDFSAEVQSEREREHRLVLSVTMPLATMVFATQVQGTTEVSLNQIDDGALMRNKVLQQRNCRDLKSYMRRRGENKNRTREEWFKHDQDCAEHTDVLVPSTSYRQRTSPLYTSKTTSA
jgi:hypothetical protein